MEVLDLIGGARIALQSLGRPERAYRGGHRVVPGAGVGVVFGLIEEMRLYPGQEKEVLNFYQSNPEAMNRLRAPVYEDKVVDYIIELADVSESETTVDALVADPEDDATTAS